MEEELEAALLSFLGFQPSRVELDAYARDHMEDIAHLYDWEPRLGSSQPDGGRPPVVLGMAQHTFVDLVCDKMMRMDPDEEVRETFLKFDISGAAPSHMCVRVCVWGGRGGGGGCLETTPVRDTATARLCSSLPPLSFSSAGFALVLDGARRKRVPDL